MPGENYYLIAALPDLPELGEEPPISLAALWEHVADSPAAPVVYMLLLAGDLLQRTSFLAGEISEVSPAVLTPGQVRDEEPLPEELKPHREESQDLPADRFYDAWARWAKRIATDKGSEFLARWVGHEVALRNAVAAARATALALEPSPYLVATDLAEDDPDLQAVITEWAAAPDPLAGMQVLDRCRWRWLDEHEKWFSFADDELAAYAMRLVLLHRWRRVALAAEGRDKR